MSGFWFLWCSAHTHTSFSLRGKKYTEEFIKNIQVSDHPDLAQGGLRSEPGEMHLLPVNG
jgi:hypothetical protein